MPEPTKNSGLQILCPRCNFVIVGIGREVQSIVAGKIIASTVVCNECAVKYEKELRAKGAKVEMDIMPEPKRFLLFGYDDDNEGGGANDIIGRFFSLEAIAKWMLIPENDKHDYHVCLNMDADRWYHVTFIEWTKSFEFVPFDPYVDLEEK